MEGKKEKEAACLKELLRCAASNVVSTLRFNAWQDICCNITV